MHHDNDQAAELHGLMAEFETADAVVHAAEKSYEAGYRQMDAYSPYPIEDLSETICGHKGSRVPLIVLCGGICGALFGFGLQYITAVHVYALNVGGRPLNSWPAFIPVTFECTILFAALSAVVGMLALNGLPQPYHPVFNVERFARYGARDRFFLCIEAKDPKFDPQETAAFLKGLNPSEVTEVES